MKKPTKTWKWLLVTALMLLGLWRLSSTWIPTYPPTFEMEGFLLIAQPDSVTCGPTSVVMVLQHYSLDVGVMDAAKLCKTHWYKKDDFEIGGSTPEYVSVALAELGVPNRVERKSSLDRVKQYVSQSRPVIAFVRSGDTSWHYVVVIGYDEKNIIIADPGWGERRVLPNEHFEGAWRFTHDLDGEDKSKPCPVCGGDGKVAEWAGPFGDCDVCAGTGKRHDWKWFLLEMGEAQGYTIIVPDEPPEE